jgi:hypothetical protein
MLLSFPNVSPQVSQTLTGFVEVWRRIFFPEQCEQNSNPHDLQWCFRFEKVNSFLQRKQYLEVASGTQKVLLWSAVFIFDC